MMILVTGGARSGKSRHAGAYWGLFTGSVYRYLANP